jgi:hypothetical protein
MFVGKIRRDKKLTPIFPKSSEHFFFPLHTCDLFVWLYETFVIAIALLNNEEPPQKMTVSVCFSELEQ